MKKETKMMKLHMQDRFGHEIKEMNFKITTTDLKIPQFIKSNTTSQDLYQKSLKNHQKLTEFLS